MATTVQTILLPQSSGEGGIEFRAAVLRRALSDKRVRAGIVRAWVADSKFGTFGVRPDKAEGHSIESLAAATGVAYARINAWLGGAGLTDRECAAIAAAIVDAGPL